MKQSRIQFNSRNVTNSPQQFAFFRVIHSLGMEIMGIVVSHTRHVIHHDHRIPMKFRINRRPASWLFSGWNWQAKVLPRATAPAKVWVP